MYIKKILWVIALMGLFVFGYFAYYVYGAMFKPNTNFSTESEYVYIPSNATYNTVRQKLLPLLKDINTFDALARQKKYIANIKAGRYLIKKGMTNNAIINSIRSKNRPLKLAFNNQNSIEVLAGRISAQIEADSTSLYNAMTDATFFKANSFTEATALGMYLPNSYEFFWNTNAIEFRNRMLKEYQKFWNDLRTTKAKTLNLTPTEVITLASIVHEESKQATEQPRVAGVYLNRLRLGMPLQADPTLKFAAYKLPKYKNTVIRRVLNTHKEINSPYNTYKNKGLPPGLIAMPDLSAIKAVLNPENHQYLYFAADPKRIGFHKFAKTLAQHNANAKAYHQYLSVNGIRK